MKTFFSFLFCLLAVLTMSCGGKTEQEKQTAENAFEGIVQSTEYRENGLNKLRPISDNVDTEAGLQVSTSMTPDETLPRVAIEDFGTYCDNRASVVVSKDGENLLNRQFTKADFEQYLDDQLRAKGILSYFGLSASDDQKICVDASISVPHTDAEANFTVTLGLDGSMNMQKNVMDDISFSADDEEIE